MPFNLELMLLSFHPLLSSLTISSAPFSKTYPKNSKMYCTSFNLSIIDMQCLNCISVWLQLFQQTLKDQSQAMSTEIAFCSSILKPTWENADMGQMPRIFPNASKMKTLGQCPAKRRSSAVSYLKLIVKERANGATANPQRALSTFWKSKAHWEQ